MNKIILICALSVFLVGCGKRIEYRDVPIPVYQVPQPPSIDRPALPIHDLTISDKTDTDKVVRAYIVSVRLLLNYSRALEEIHQTYKDLADRTDDSFIEPVFSMSVQEEAEPLQLTDLERRRLVAQGRQNREDAHSRFRSISISYMEREEKIRREYEAEND